MVLFADGIGSLMERQKDGSQWANLDLDENLELSVSWH